ncbi:MAG: RNA-binding protein [Limisphaerales bacterium]
MLSNERPSGPRPRHHSPGPPKPPLPEDSLRTEKLTVERKLFIFTLRENPRGRFLRITEDVQGRRDTIIIPASGLDDFHQSLGEMARTSAESPDHALPSADDARSAERQLD